MARSRNPALPQPLEAHVGFWMRFVSNHVSGRFRRSVEEAGVSVTEWVALRTLYDGEVTTHAALIDALGMTKGAASKVLTRLEEKGLAQRHYGEDSAKAQVLALTAAGRALVPRLASLADANDAHFFGHLDATERKALVALLQDLVQRHQLKDLPVD
ncbi:MarR family winged helix-turn-helix transcriptional regulator [Uliginosibacterium sp. H1]|uniref:MarR family winged helix-turn-helix transcriptional regulator n=1 Tax=Uliginosibacterium sp. H1 TaxID=3114757 RepID=UPI002E17483A|nr:MarR family winged helix-turn-helix transcriptional regulator [Uliginosibacterium sp. H1]